MSNLDILDKCARKFIESKDYSSLYDLIENSRIPIQFKSALLRDLNESMLSGKTTSACCKELINGHEENSIYGVFSARYFPSLSVDGVKYRPLSLPTYPGVNLDSPVVPVVIIEATHGFHDQTVVALFPENHLDGIQKSTDKIFYFIDKFVARHFSRTSAILEQFTTVDSFPRVKRLTKDEVEEFSIHWVWLHEYFHRVGPLPIPEYLDIKSCRPLAGLEECRVDMEAICFVHDCEQIPEHTKHKISEFILSERILRYSVEGIPHPNYDAIGSQVLVNYLRGKGYIVMHSDTLELKSNYIEAIQSFINDIRKIERHIEWLPRLEVKQKLLEFVNSNLNMEYTSTQYIHDPFFEMVRDHLIEPKVASRCL